MCSLVEFVIFLESKGLPSASLDDPKMCPVQYILNIFFGDTCFIKFVPVFCRFTVC